MKKSKKQEEQIVKEISVVAEAGQELAPILRKFFRERDMKVSEAIEVTFWALYRIIEPTRQRVTRELEKRGEI